jgi:hypothetical protein
MSDDVATPLGVLGRPRAPVRVALFDAWPMLPAKKVVDPVTEEMVRVPAGPLDAIIARSGSVSNPRLQQAAEGKLVPAGRIYDYVGDRPASPLRCRPLDCDGKVQEPYSLADHGLFVADIINDIAPGAELHVYRVIDDYGGTDLELVARAFRHAIHAARGRRIIINMSMGFGPQVMLARELIRRAGEWYTNPEEWREKLVPGAGALVKAGVQAAEVAAYQAAEQLNPTGDEAASTATAGSRDAREEIKSLRKQGLIDLESNRFRGELLALELIFSTKGARNVLVIAAAGNDSCQPKRVVGPRMPAAIEGVLGVSSYLPPEGKAQGTESGQNWIAAHYTNEDDFFPPDDGVGAYGGRIEGGAVTDGLYGLYVSDLELAGGHMGNTTGYAQWAGTSFAAPIATGVAADLWAKDPSLTPDEIIRRICIAEDGKPQVAIPLRQTAQP